MRQSTHAHWPKNAHGKRIHTGQETNTHRHGMTNAGVQPRTLARHLACWSMLWLEEPLTRKKKRGVKRVGKEKKTKEKKKNEARRRRRNKEEEEKEKRN